MRQAPTAPLGWILVNAMERIVPTYASFAVLAIMMLLASEAAQAAEEARAPCTEDAMIVFDASGSMAGNMVQGIFNDTTRMDEVRKALAEVLPGAAKFRKIGLITYGPGPYRQCNVNVDLRPIPNATEHIMSVVNFLNPAGKTPLVAAVEEAAEVLDYQAKPGVVILLTDGEETCDGAPCALGKSLNANSQLTVHVIGFKLAGFTWTGTQSIVDVKCLAEKTGGLYIPAESREDLVRAFKKTLSCPMMSAISARQPTRSKKQD